MREKCRLLKRLFISSNNLKDEKKLYKKSDCIIKKVTKNTFKLGHIYFSEMFLIYCIFVSERWLDTAEDSGSGTRIDKIGSVTFGSIGATKSSRWRTSSASSKNF